MTVPTLNYDMAGNNQVSAGYQISYDSMTNVPIPAASRPYQLAGTGVPTFSAPKGSTYVDLTAAGANLRMYINTNGTTGWAAVTSA